MESKVAALEAEGARQQRAAEAAVAQLRKESDTGEELQRLLVSEGEGSSRWAVRGLAMGAGGERARRQRLCCHLKMAVLAKVAGPEGTNGVSFFPFP